MPPHNTLMGIAKAIVPQGVRAWIVRMQKKYRLQTVRAGTVEFGHLRRLKPISPIFGMDRGLPIDRYYIERFLAAHASDIKGRVLELGDPFYINKFGGDKVTQADILHYTDGNEQATIVADLTDAEHIPSNSFDCIIFTQTIQMIYEPKLALHTLHRILKPGGVLLLTSAGIAKIGRRLGRDDWGEYWHFTTQSAEAIFKETFPGAGLDISSCGNVFAATCFLHGLASEEISEDELDHRDPDFEVLVTVRAQKTSEA